eukprot:TRINITY_DN27139_c0_g1_i1.p4 TRINITY_DN27139_c0_g1~~TRINITY_DN27139_c0_g1_i1.p4  ORF type:complete len:170 (+),score=53.14 TRINITY_DN27139_c0_g1_i1:45-512(+)
MEGRRPQRRPFWLPQAEGVAAGSGRQPRADSVRSPASRRPRRRRSVLRRPDAGCSRTRRRPAERRAVAQSPAPALRPRARRPARRDDPPLRQLQELLAVAENIRSALAAPPAASADSRHSDDADSVEWELEVERQRQILRMERLDECTRPYTVSP